MEMNQESSQQKQVYRFQWTGDAVDLFVVMLVNVLLTTVTFGLYTPWSRTRFRQYLWGHTSFEQDRATYSGTGWELARGWVRLFAIIITIYIAFVILSLIPFLGLIFAFSGLLIYPFLFAIGIYAGTRYRLSRTEWRGVHFGLERRTKDFIWLYLQGAVISAFTMGIYYPWFKNETRKFLTEKAYYGTGRFTYSGDGMDLFKIYLKGIFLSIVTLGIYIPWLLLNLAKYKIEKTNFVDGRSQTSQFQLDLNGAECLKLSLIWFFGILLTFGIAAPFLIHYTLKKVLPKLTLVGHIDFGSIYSTAATGGATADAAVDYYDIDLGFF